MAGVKFSGVFRKRATEDAIVPIDFSGALGEGESIVTVGSRTYTPSGLTDIGDSIVGVSEVQLLLRAGKAPVVVTVDTDTDTLNAIAHGLVDGTQVHLVGCCLPTGFDTRLTYWVVNKTDDTLQLAKCKGGDPLAFTDDGDGELSLGVDHRCLFQVTTSEGQKLDADFETQIRD